MYGLQRKGRRMFLNIHIVDLIALAILAYEFVRGALRGALLSILGIIRIILGYWAAYRFGPEVGARLRVPFAIANTTASLLGGLIVFLIVLFLFGLILGYLGREQKRRIRAGQTSLSGLSRLIGGLCGILMGAVTIIIICWLYSALRGTNLGDKLPDIDNSLTMKSTRSLVEKGAYHMLKKQIDSEERAHRLAEMISSPDETGTELRTLVEEPSITGLLQNKEFGDDFLSGNALRIQSNSAFQRVVRDTALIRRVSRLGLLPDDISSGDLQTNLSTYLATVGEKADKVLNDPAFAAKVEELQKEGLLERAKIHQLIVDSRFHELLDRLSSTVIEPKKLDEGSPPPVIESPEISE